MQNRRKFSISLTVLWAGALALGNPATSTAQAAYPVRPLKLIVPFPPGGSSDVLARLIAQKLTESLGQPVAVENRPGASGNIGHEIAARSAPDGYTLLLSNSSTLVTNPHLFKRLSFDPLTDFAPISMVASAGQVLVVHPSVAATTLAELTALAKAKAGQLNFGSGGMGILSHISGEMYKSAAAVNIVHIPYKGGILAVTDLVAGQIQMVFADMVPAIPQIKAGKLRALAVTSPQRSAALPDVPTMIEAGIAGFDASGWWAIVAPRGTPAEVIARINADLGKIMAQADVKDAFTRLGVATEYSSPAKVQERIKAESPLTARILKAAGVEPE